MLACIPENVVLFSTSEGRGLLICGLKHTNSASTLTNQGGDQS